MYPSRGNRPLCPLASHGPLGSLGTLQLVAFRTSQSPLLWGIRDEQMSEKAEHYTKSSVPG